MSKADNAEQGIKDNWRVNSLVIVQLSQVFDCRNAALIILETVPLQSILDILKYRINDQNRKVRVISNHCYNKEGK